MQLKISKMDISWLETQPKQSHLGELNKKKSSDD